MLFDATYDAVGGPFIRQDGSAGQLDRPKLADEVSSKPKL